MISFLEVQMDLLMAFGVLFPPEFEQQRRQLCQNHFGAMHFSVAPRTERDHQMQMGFARHPVMDRNRSLISPRGAADPAAVTVSFKYGFPEASKVLLILAFEGVAGRAETLCENFVPSTRAIHRRLSDLLHVATYYFYASNIPSRRVQMSTSSLRHCRRPEIIEGKMLSTMRIDLDQSDILRLINVGEILKDGVTITLRVDEPVVATARQGRPAVVMEMPLRPLGGDEESARELEMRQDDALRKVETLLELHRQTKDSSGS
jgi:hypothetical protein